MKTKKDTGSFYTPKVITEFMVDYLSEKMKDSISVSILEPSAGDGAFVQTIYDNSFFCKKIEKLVAVEQNEGELKKITEQNNYELFVPIHSDFLDFQINNNEKFSLVIGNPPYVKKSLLSEKQLEICRSIHKQAGLLDHTPKNLWTAFLVRCIEFTGDDGILAFVLPAELLQVKFAEELRELIIKEFSRVEIFTFSELLFDDCKGQDTLLLICQREAAGKGVYYCNIDKTSNLSKKDFKLNQNIKTKESKWTHHHINTDEIELLERLKVGLKFVNDYSSSKPGIVTAANDYFIVNAETVRKYSLDRFVKPIIQKGVFVNGSVELDSAEFQQLVNSSKPTYLLALDKNSVIRNNARIRTYLDIGELEKIDQRYKTLLRNKWYEVPNIGVPSEAFFFKRCSKYPKIVKNTANVLATDSAYIVNMHEGYTIENFIYSFYNSLTLSFAELYGRFYGGGVLELTPMEFKSLPIPYSILDHERFTDYVTSFKSKVSIKDVCRMNDSRILRSVYTGIDNETLDKIASIREKLYLHRIKEG